MIHLPHQPKANRVRFGNDFGFHHFRPVSRDSPLYGGNRGILRTALGRIPALMSDRPSTTTVDVAGRKVGISHGDEHMVGGWNCSREELSNPARQKELDAFMEENGLDVFTTTHTCAAAAIVLDHGAFINNGAAGLPNFAGQDFGLAVRIAEEPHPDALFGAKRGGLFIEAVPVRYDQNAYVEWFDKLWPQGTPAEISYRGRLVNGPADEVAAALLGGFEVLE